MTYISTTYEKDTKPMTEPYKTALEAFATTVGKTTDEVQAVFATFVGDGQNDEALADLQDPELTSPDALSAELKTLKVPVAKAKKAIKALQPTVAAPVTAAPAPEVAAPAPTASFVPKNLLPDLPDDVSLLQDFKIGGVLKVSEHDAVGAVRVAFAAQFGLFTLPEQLSEAMERRAESLEEPAGEAYYRVRAEITKRKYAEVLAAFPGIDGSYVTKNRQQRLIERINTLLLPALKAFAQTCDNWTKSWMAGNPAEMLSGMMMALRNPAMAGLAMAPPDVSPVVTQAEEFITVLNRTMAGDSLPVVRALTGEVVRVSGFLNDPAMAMLCGFQTREEMLKGLRVGLTSDAVRTEQTLAKIVLSVLRFPSIPTSDMPEYIIAVARLFQSVNVDNVFAPKAPSRSGRSSGEGKDSHFFDQQHKPY